MKKKKNFLSLFRKKKKKIPERGDAKKFLFPNFPKKKNKRSSTREGAAGLPPPPLLAQKRGRGRIATHEGIIEASKSPISREKGRREGT